MSAEQMLFPPQAEKPPLPAVGYLQDELAAFLHQQTFQYNGAVSAMG